MKCFDFNIATYNYCKSQGASVPEGITSESWIMDQRGNVWYEKESVSAFVKNHHKFIESMVDEIGAFESQIVGFSTQSTSKFFSLALAARFKEKKNTTPIIFGGPLVFKNCYGPDILKDHAFLDAISFSEADTALPAFLDLFEQSGFLQPVPGFAVRSASGEITVGNEPGVVDDLDKIPYADYTDFSGEHYTKQLIPIATSRGCINRCAFCAESPHWRRFRRRSAENIVREIIMQLGQYPQTNEFWFNDSLINGDIAMLEELCDLIISRGLKIRWGGQAMIRKEMNVSFLKKMKAAGCYLISYGVESGSDAMLKLMRKGYAAALAERVLHDTHAVGIDVIFNIMVGFPGEDDKRFRETKDFVRRCRQYASHIELPTYLLLKGSFVFNHLEDFAIAPVDYSNEDWQLNWKTKDNTNTYQIRKDRWAELWRLVGSPQS